MNTQKFKEQLEKRYNHNDYIFFMTSDKRILYYYYDKIFNCKIINFTPNEKIFIDMINILLKDRCNNFNEYKKELKNTVIPYILITDYITVEKTSKSDKFKELINNS